MRRQAFNVGSCPFCGSGRIKVTSTTRPFRFFSCKVCERSWKCLEVIIGRDFWLSDVLLELLSQGRLSEYDFESKRAIAVICNAEKTNL